MSIGIATGETPKWRREAFADQPPVFDQQVAVDMAVHSLETRLDEILAAHNRNPSRVHVNYLELHSIKTKLDFLLAAMTAFRTAAE